MNPLELEACLKGVIEAEFGKKVPVTTFPDNIETHRMLGNSEILLGYRGGSFERPQLGTKMQTRNISFELVVMARSMAGHGGAVEILDRLRTALQGVKIQGVAVPVYIVRDAYLGRATAQWYYSLEIALIGVPAYPRPEEQPPRINRVSAGIDRESLEVNNGKG